MTTVLAPDTRHGRGTGHIRRCLKLLDHLPESVIYIPQRGDSHARGQDSLSGLLDGVERVVGQMPQSPDRVVIDRFDVGIEYVRSLGGATTIGIDLSGPGRALCLFLVDMLPRLDAEMANVTDFGFLELPEEDASCSPESDRILITFGGEDPGILTETCVRELVLRIGIDPDRITVVAPGLRELGSIPSGVRILKPVPSLVPLIADHPYVICSFGLTAFESQKMGAAVLTVAPTRYHDALAKRSGLLTAGVRTVRRSPLKSFVTAHPRALQVSPLVENYRRRDLATLITSISARNAGCPVHPGERGVAVWRFPEKTYFRCPACGIVYLARFGGEEVTYSSRYFEEEYKAQYGKTYLEDFETIQLKGRQRLSVAMGLRKDLKTVLDVGCAYGPFLAATAEAGLEPFGIDVSTSAVDYVRTKLNLSAVAGSVLEVDPALAFGRDDFDLVSLWYVIEHFPDLRLLLSKLSKWVKPGGILALATPNGRGVSGRRRPRTFFAESPDDHFTVWDPESAATVLGEFGFRVLRQISTGHHSERYPGVSRGWLPSTVASVHSRVFGRGDTFEVYSVREVES